MTDIVQRLRSAPISVGAAMFQGHALLADAADEIERLRLFERYANRTVEGQVADAIAYKAEHGKYPFED